VWVFWGWFFRWVYPKKTHRVFWVRTRESEPWAVKPISTQLSTDTLIRHPQSDRNELKWTELKSPFSSVALHGLYTANELAVFSSVQFTNCNKRAQFNSCVPYASTGRTAPTWVKSTQRTSRYEPSSSRTLRCTNFSWSAMVLPRTTLIGQAQWRHTQRLQTSQLPIGRRNLFVLRVVPKFVHNFHINIGIFTSRKYTSTAQVHMFDRIDATGNGRTYTILNKSHSDHNSMIWVSNSVHTMSTW